MPLFLAQPNSNSCEQKFREKLLYLPQALPLDHVFAFDWLMGVFGCDPASHTPHAVSVHVIRNFGLGQNLLVPELQAAFAEGETEL